MLPVHRHIYQRRPLHLGRKPLHTIKPVMMASNKQIGEGEQGEQDNQ